MLTDLEIANKNKLQRIQKIAKKLGLKKSQLDFYGKYIAKINYNMKNKNDGKLILVTAITPTASGEGKTTVSIGLADALSRLKKKTCLALREPSLGPVFGIKGGACGGGYSQVVPMENINLHFTGDMHAITSANNLLSAIIDNHIYQGNDLKINKVYFERCIDVNDRALKSITLSNERVDKFTITSASEVMAILSLAKDLNDLKNKLGNIIVGENDKGKFIYAKDLKAHDAMTILLKDALKPNLVQTLEDTPAIIHCGPFANIAHGCNSIVATKMALNTADYVVTEAGFGADLGAEKFLDLKCQTNGLTPNCVCLVATIKALKMHGGVQKNDLNKENILLLKVGLENLKRHIENIKNVYKLPLVVAINRFSTDTDSEVNSVQEFCKELDIDAISITSFKNGAMGGVELAKKVISLCKQNNGVEFAYNMSDSVKQKINKIAKKIYRAKSVEFSEDALCVLKKIKTEGLDKLPVVIAKTQYSFTDDKNLINAPRGFTLHIRDLKICAGAGFIVAIAGNMLLMPGLGAHSAYEGMSIDENGKVVGLF